jgi:hypothetical protein
VAEEPVKRKDYSVEERAALLGEKPEVREEKGQARAVDEDKEENTLLTAKTKVFMSKLSDQSKKMLCTENKFVQGSTQIIPGTENVNYFPDERKNERFKIYIAKQETTYLGDIPYPLVLRSW